MDGACVVPHNIPERVFRDHGDAYLATCGRIKWSIDGELAGGRCDEDTDRTGNRPCSNVSCRQGLITLRLESRCERVRASIRGSKYVAFGKDCLSVAARERDYSGVARGGVVVRILCRDC